MTMWRFVNKESNLILESNDLRFLLHEMQEVHGVEDANFMNDLIVYGKSDVKVKNEDGVEEEAYIEQIAM